MMLNPYTLLTPAILDGMLRQPMYFVRQYYKRGTDPFDEGIPLLLTHYIHHPADIERSERHMRLLKMDKHRFLYDSTNPEHLERLRVAASQPAGFHIYINLLPREWKATDGLKKKIREFMLQRFPEWTYSPSDRLKVTLKERYGELYLGFLWKGQQAEVNLDEIESFSLCAMT